MISQERDGGRLLPTTWDPSIIGLQWSFRLAYTNGVLNTNTNWVYYELPDTSILSRSRNSNLDNMSQQVSISVLAEALPDYFEPLNYWMLEADLVDSNGYRWPYHTGRIESIKESTEYAGGAAKRVLDISSFGVLQNLKDSYTLEDRFNPSVTNYSGYMTPYGTVKHASVLGTGRAIGTLQVVAGTWNTLDLLVTGTFPGFVLSTNSDFSAPYTRGVQYDLVNSSGAAINVVTSKNELIYVKWLVAEPAVRYYMKFWTVDYFAVASSNGSTYPDSFRVPDCNIPFSYGYRPSLKRNTWDDFVTTVAAGATTLVVTPIDAESYKQTLATNPAGSPTEFLEWMKADTLATEVRQISSVSAVTGAVTVSVAFSAAPAADDFIRVVSTRCFTAFERNNNDGSVGVVNRPRFYKQLAGTEYAQGAFNVVAEQGIVTANYGNHFQTGVAARLYVTDLVVLTQTTSTFGTDNRIESSAYLAVVDFVPSRVYSGNSSDGVNYFGNHQPMNSWTQNLNISGGTRQETLQALVDNGFPPNGRIFDRPDGSVLVAAIKQRSEPQYSLSNVINVSQDAVPQPLTAVTVLSKYPAEYRLPRGSFDAETTGFTNDFYLFDGVDNPDPTNSGTDFAFASVASSGVVSIRIPEFGKTVIDPISKIVIKGLSGVVLCQIVTLTTAGDIAQKVLWLKGGQYQVISQGSEITINGDEITKALAFLRNGNGFRDIVYAAVRMNFIKSDIVSTGATDMLPRITEIEVYTNYLTSWTAYLTDDQAYTDDLGTFPTGWTTTNSTSNSGLVWWKRDRLNRSFKYMDPTTFRRIQPLWNADWVFNLYRHVYINQTRISTNDCREIGERYLDELVKQSQTFDVKAYLDPRMEIGDTVAVQLPDGTVKDLLVWEIRDSGGPDDQTMDVKLVDYAA